MISSVLCVVKHKDFYDPRNFNCIPALSLFASFFELFPSIKGISITYFDFILGLWNEKGFYILKSTILFSLLSHIIISWEKTKNMWIGAYLSLLNTNRRGSGLSENIIPFALLNNDSQIFASIPKGKIFVFFIIMSRTLDKTPHFRGNLLISYAPKSKAFCGSVELCSWAS